MGHFFESGFSVREPAWHGLAEVLDEYPGRKEGRKLAGHDWEPEKRQLFIGPDEGVPNIPVPGWSALIRSDSQAVIGCVKDTYTVISNETVWDIVDALAKQEKVKYETAGVLKGGEIVWVMARVDTPKQIPGDDSQVFPYLTVVGKHGVGATVALVNEIRCICWNTVSAAEADAERSGRCFTFRHTANVYDRIQQAKETLAGVGREHEAFIELAEELGKTPISKAGVRHFVETLLPEPAADVLSDRVRTNLKTARDSVYGLLEGRTVPDAHRRTGWGLYNAGVEYIDHLRAHRTDESYFRRCILTPERAKFRLAGLVREAAELN